MGLLALAGTLAHAQEAIRIKMNVIPGALRFAMDSFDVHAGAAVEIEFQNNGLMPHNMLITAPGAADKVVLDAMALGGEGMAKSWVPDTFDVLFSTKLVDPTKTEMLRFMAPPTPGDYPFVCTFPGHGNTMRGVMHVKAAGANLIAAVARAPEVERQIVDTLADVEYSSKPLGTPEKPLVIRTFVPNPDLGSDVLVNHHRGHSASRYSPNTGMDRPGIVDPVHGIPASVAVNFGEELSYCWDTTECRLLYAWSGGFFDFENYWGGGGGGGRKSFDYVPRLEGSVFYKALGAHPFASLGEHPEFLGFKLERNVPVFSFKLGRAEVSEKLIKAGGNSLRMAVSIKSCISTKFAIKATPMARFSR